MDTRILEYLIVIEQEKSLTKAAEKIHISPSALSQNLSKIEQELQAPLFTHTARQWIPTPIGRCYLDGARQMIQVKEDVYHKIAKLSVSKTQTKIRIAICPQVYSMYSHRIVSELRTQLPDLHFEFHKADSIAAREYLINNIADAAIICKDNRLPSLLSSRFLYSEKLVLAVPAEMQAEIHMPDYNRLRHFPFILPPKGSHLSALIESALDRKNLKFSNTYQANDMEEVRLLMEHGYGAALLPERMTKTSENYQVYEWKPSLKYDIALVTLRDSQKDVTWERVYSVLYPCLINGI